MSFVRSSSTLSDDAFVPAFNRNGEDFPDEKKRSSKKDDESSGSSWFWFLVAALVFFLLAFLFWPESESEPEASEQAQADPVPVVGGKKGKVAPTPQPATKEEAEQVVQKLTEEIKTLPKTSPRRIRVITEIKDITLRFKIPARKLPDPEVPAGKEKSEDGEEPVAEKESEKSEDDPSVDPVKPVDPVKQQEQTEDLEDLASVQKPALKSKPRFWWVLGFLVSLAVLGIGIFFIWNSYDMANADREVMFLDDVDTKRIIGGIATALGFICLCLFGYKTANPGKQNDTDKTSGDKETDFLN